MKEIKIIPALTGIRALCVYLIFLKHFEPFNKIKHPYLFAFFDQFYIFLSFFFVLSGFVIYYKYHSVTLSEGRLRKYFIHRIARIFPILIILTALTFWLGYREGLYDKAQAIKLFLLNITLLKGFSSEYYLTGIGPSWSLSVEELFYLLAPVLFMIGKNIRTIAKLLLIIYVAGFIITIFFIQFPRDGFFNSFTFTFSFTFFGRCFEFFCGICLAKFFLHKENVVAQIKAKSVMATGFLIVVITLICLWQISISFQTRHGIDIWAGIALQNLLLPIGIVFIYYGLIYSTGAITRFFSSRIMVALGNSTYSFYLLHTSFAISLIFKYVSDNFFISLACMMLFAYIFHKLVEQPLAILVKKSGETK